MAMRREMPSDAVDRERIGSEFKHDQAEHCLPFPVLGEFDRNPQVQISPGPKIEMAAGMIIAANRISPIKVDTVSTQDDEIVFFDTDEGSTDLGPDRPADAAFTAAPLDVGIACRGVFAAHCRASQERDQPLGRRTRWDQLHGCRRRLNRPACPRCGGLLVAFAVSDGTGLLVPGGRMAVEFATSFASPISMRSVTRDCFELTADGTGVLRLLEPARVTARYENWELVSPGRLAGFTS
jgi:hypothetical protein